MPEQPMARACGAQLQRRSAGGAASVAAARAAGGFCSHLFSLFLARALNDAVGQDLVPHPQPLS